MTGKTHAGVGIVTFVALCDRLPGKFSYMGILVVGVASLLPDVDHPKSIFNKYILPFKNKTTKFVIYAGMGIIAIALDYLCFNKPIIKVFGFILIMIGFSSHREGITHSIVGMIIFTIIISYIGKEYKIPNIIYYFLIGYSTHIICDMFTKRGVPLFYPFKNKKYKFPLNFTTGSKFGKTLEEIIMIAGLMYIIYKLPFILI